MLNCFQRVCISEDLLFILPICSTCMKVHDRVEWHSKHCLCKSHDRGKEKKSKEYGGGGGSGGSLRGQCLSERSDTIDSIHSHNNSIMTFCSYDWTLCIHPNHESHSGFSKQLQKAQTGASCSMRAWLYSRIEPLSNMCLEKSPLPSFFPWCLHYIIKVDAWLFFFYFVWIVFLVLSSSITCSVIRQEIHHATERWYKTS